MKLLLATLILFTVLSSAEARCRIEHQFFGPDIKVGCHKPKHHARKPSPKAFGMAAPVMEPDTWNAALQKCSADWERQRRAGR